MPAINPNNYNIDFFSTYSFGDITDTSYLSYLFQQNLTDIAPELINSPAGDFQDIYNTEKGLEKDINYTSISNPGSIDEWLIEGNFPLSLLEQAYQNPSQGVGANQYGPSTLQTFDYENPDLIVEDTGYIGYPTSTGGGVVNNILSEGLDAVGLGGLNNLFLIDFDSPLNDIAKERRLEELKERTKQNFIQETVGKINADPLGLLAGQPLFQQDYSITKRTGLIGGAVNAIGDLTGLQLPISPIPEGAFGQILAQQGKIEEALAKLDQLQGNDRLEGEYLKAEILYSYKSFPEQARTIWEKFVRLNSENILQEILVLCSKANLLSTDNKIKESHEEWLKIYKIYK